MIHGLDEMLQKEENDLFLDGQVTKSPDPQGDLLAEGYRKGLQFVLDFCDSKIKVYEKIYKDDFVSRLKSIQEYLDVKNAIKEELSKQTL